MYLTNWSSSKKKSYKESVRYIKHNNPQLTHALHILRNLHECGTIDIAMSLLRHVNNLLILIPINNSTFIYTGCLQKNGAVSKVNKEFISHLTRAKRTPSAAATVQVSHALPAVRSLVLTAGLRGQFPR